jgi:hypothetical protein
MKIAHLVLAHKNPQQLERMLEALDHPQCDFFIHLDKKADISQFIYLGKKGKIFFVEKRVDVRWACYSLVQAQLNGMEEIVATGRYNYINVMSGQDFPLYPAQTIYDFFTEHSGKEFISAKAFHDEEEWWREALYRVKRYHFQNWRIPGKYRIQHMVNKIFPDRKYPLNHILAGRSQWFSITTVCAKYILDFLKEHPEVVRFFKYVWGADEFIFSTIVYNSSFRQNVNDTLMYTDWSEKNPNPKILTTKDYDTIIHSGKLFARKFDIEKDADIFMMLEERASGKALHIN